MNHFQKFLLVFLILAPVSLASAEIISEENKDPKVGDVLVVNSPSTEHFQHIYFPEPGEIQKRIGSLDYKQVYGMEVRITKIQNKSNGTVIVTLKPLHGKKFFGHWQSVQANYSQAMEAGELNISY